MSKKKEKPVPRVRSISENTINWILIAVIVVLPLIYFASLLSGSRMMYGSDWLLQGYADRKWISDCIKQFGQGPMWNSHVFSGLPIGNPYSLHTLVHLILPVHIGWTYLFVLGTIFAGLGMYWYLKELKLSLFSSFAGAIAYMGCGAVLSTPYAGHEGKLLATAFFPLILLFLHKGLARHKPIHFLLAGGIGGFAAVNAHFQLVYYATIVFVFYLTFHLIWQRRENGTAETLKLISYAFYGLLLAVGLALIHYLPQLGGLGWGARGATRGYEFSTSWSLPPSELLDLLTPRFSGGLQNYWGLNYFKLHTEYLGILPLVLALIAIAFKSREKYVRFFIGLCIITVVFALGRYTPFYHIPYWVLPGLKKFRAPAMIFYLTSFGIAALAAYGTQFITKAQDPRHSKAGTPDARRISILLGIVFAALLIFTLVCSAGKESVLSTLKAHFQPLLSATYGPQMTQQKIGNLAKNYAYFASGLGKALFLVVLNSILILLVATRKLKLGIGIPLLALVLVIDQWVVEKGFLKTVDHPTKYYARDEIVTFLGGDQSRYRVFPLYYEHAQDAYLSLHDVQSLGGYVSNPGERYQKFIGAGESVMFTPSNLMKQRRMLDILNTKYLISPWIPEDISQQPANVQKGIENFKLSFAGQWGISWEEAHGDLDLVYRGNRGLGVYQNKTAMPRAWIVHSFEVLSRDEILDELKNLDFRPDSVVLLEEEPSERRESRSERRETPSESREATDERREIEKTENQETEIETETEDKRQEIETEKDEGVEIKEYTPNRIVCQAVLHSPGFLVFSENWHPAWKVYVDGKRSKLYVADYTIRAVELDNGEHTVEFVYESGYFKLGAILFMVSFLFFVGVIVVWVRSRKKAS